MFESLAVARPLHARPGASALVLQLTDEATPRRPASRTATWWPTPSAARAGDDTSIHTIRWGNWESTADALATSHPRLRRLGRMVRVTQPTRTGRLARAPVSSSHYNGAGSLAAIGPDSRSSSSTTRSAADGRTRGLVHNRARAYAETGALSDGSNQGLFDTERWRRP